MPGFVSDTAAKPDAETDERQEKPAKVSGDRDEAKALPDVISARRPGSPDAEIHHPAAASADVDSEAGSDDAPVGRIEPLQRR